MSASPFPRSIAIAGAWGYIGRKFLDVALARNLDITVLDPGPAPAEIDLSRVHRVPDAEAFARTRAEVFHLAVHPEHRRLDLLLDRHEPLVILNEKPMAEPGHPEACLAVLDAVAHSPAIVAYDFPELFDPLTARVLDHLASYRDLRLTHISVQRSKDRENPANPRNYKRMLPIQYQETVHCLAWILHLLSTLQGGLEPLLNRGLRIAGESSLYRPPNPEAYPRPVDGRCQFLAEIGGVAIDGLTDFTQGASWIKRRVVRGIGDGFPFEIAVSYLEGHKSLRFNGIDQPCDPLANSYEAVLATLSRWVHDHNRDTLMSGLFPHPTFARDTYQLSTALWQSCQRAQPVTFTSAQELRDYEPPSPPP